MNENLTYTQVQEYLQGLAHERPEEMIQMEAYAKEHRFPIIGPVCGYLCYQVAHMIGAKKVYELGSGYGYSTAWFAKAVQENGGGVVHHVVWDEELSRMAKEHLANLGYGELVEYSVSEATEALEQTPGPFDLVFCDIDKHGYPAALPVMKEKLRSGGVMLVDNMLIQGRIFDDKDDTENVAGVREFTRMVNADPDWISTIIPIRDGLLLAWKK